jgi:hypothetical protein
MDLGMLDLADKWVPLAGFVLNGLLVGGFFILRKTFVSREDYELGQTHLTETARGVETRLTEVEMRLDSLPGPEAVQQLLVSLARVEGKLQGMGERIEGIQSNVRLLMRVHVGDDK